MKYRTLDALRGLAALMVVLFHSPFAAAAPSALVANGNLFVDFFFILSGFVLCFAYGDRIAAGLSLSGYLVLRLGRLFPLHAALMLAWLVYLVASRGTGSGFSGSETAGSFLLNLFLLNSYGFETRLAWNYPSWSIGAELFAYLAFFLVISGRRRALSGPAALAISALAYAALLLDDGGRLVRTHDLGFLRCLGGFFLGVAVFRLHATLAAARPAPGALAELAVAALTLALLSLPPGSVAAQLATLAGFALCILVFAASSGPLSRALRRPFPALLGRVSYSVYMLHALLFSLAADLAQPLLGLPSAQNLLAANPSRSFLLTPHAPALNLAIVAATILLSLAAYRWIEKPCRDWSQRVARGAMRLAPTAGRGSA